MKKSKLRVIYKNIGKMGTTEQKEESYKRINTAFDYIFEEIEKDNSTENQVRMK